MGRSRELTGNPANSETPGVQVKRQASRGVPAVPDGFLTDIHHFWTRIIDPGHLGTPGYTRGDLPAPHHQPGLSRILKEARRRSRAKTGFREPTFLKTHFLFSKEIVTRVVPRCP